MTMIPAAQLPHVRTRLVEELSQPGNPVTTTFELALAAGVQAPAHRRIMDQREQAELLTRNERKRLARAALYWISPNMTALTLAAAPGMPPFRPTAADLPAPYGLVYFAAPFADADETPLVDAAMFDDGSIRTFKPGRFSVCAATWGPWDYQGMWARGGTWFTFYTLRQDDLPGLPLRLDNECVVAAGHDEPGEDPLLDEATRQDGTAAWMHLVLTAFRLMATSRTASSTPQTPGRAFRRRAARAGVDRPGEPVQLVDITTRPRTARAVDGQDGRAYRVRWIVSGHWRNQYYPTRDAHRPRWIEPYVKGPEGAPLRTNERVTLWREPTEPAGGGR